MIQEAMEIFAARHHVDCIASLRWIAVRDVAQVAEARSLPIKRTIFVCAQLHGGRMVCETSHDLRATRRGSALRVFGKPASRRGQRCWTAPALTGKSAFPHVNGQKGHPNNLDCGHNHERLNCGGNLATAMFVRNRGFRVVGCNLQFSWVSGFNFIAKRSSLTIGDSRNAR